MHALANRALAGTSTRRADCARRSVLGLLEADPGVRFRGGDVDVAAIEAAIAERLAVSRHATSRVPMQSAMSGRLRGSHSRTGQGTSGEARRRATRRTV